MTDTERKEIYDNGWHGFFNGKKLEDCPDYPEQEKRDEWCCAWLSAEAWSEQDPNEYL